MTLLIVKFQVHNFKSVEELYKWSSCIYYLNKISTPMVFINALDDPIIHESLLKPIQEHASKFDIIFKKIWCLKIPIVLFLSSIIFFQIKKMFNVWNYNDYFISQQKQCRLYTSNLLTVATWVSMKEVYYIPIL